MGGGLCPGQAIELRHLGFAPRIMKTRLQRIEETIASALTLSYLDVADESSGHNVPAGAESHFKVTAVSAVFAGESRINRHRRINALLESEFAAGMHACALHYTAMRNGSNATVAPQSPACAGASKPPQTERKHATILAFYNSSKLLT